MSLLNTIRNRFQHSAINRKRYVLYSAVSSPLDHSKRFTLFLPWQTCSFRHQLGFSWKHSSYAAITRDDYSLTCPPLSIAKYSFIPVGEWTEASGRERKCPNFETVAKGIRTRALSIASLAFYHWATALHIPCYDSSHHSPLHHEPFHHIITHSDRDLSIVRWLTFFTESGRLKVASADWRSVFLGRVERYTSLGLQVTLVSQHTHHWKQRHAWETSPLNLFKYIHAEVTNNANIHICNRHTRMSLWNVDREQNAFRHLKINAIGKYYYEYRGLNAEQTNP